MPIWRSVVGPGSSARSQSLKAIRVPPSSSVLPSTLSLLPPPLPIRPSHVPGSPLFAMNSMHDPHVHNKRTSINELLNPVSATSSSLDHSYGRQQLPSLSAALQYPHHRHLPPPPQYPQQPPPQINCEPAYSLRAASWESSKDGLGPPVRSESGSAPCRYSSSSSAPPHPMYAEGYQRHGRAVEEAPHYGVETTQSWPSSHETPSASYGPPMMSPVYSGERTGKFSSVIDVSDQPANADLCPSGARRRRAQR